MVDTPGCDYSVACEKHKRSRILRQILFFFALYLDSPGVVFAKIHYRVRAGDSLGNVLNKLGYCPIWGASGFRAKVLELNGLTSESTLEVGRVLELPDKSLPSARELKFSNVDGKRFVSVNRGRSGQCAGAASSQAQDSPRDRVEFVKSESDKVDEKSRVKFDPQAAQVVESVRDRVIFKKETKLKASPKAARVVPEVKKTISQASLPKGKQSKGSTLLSRIFESAESDETDKVENVEAVPEAKAADRSRKTKFKADDKRKARIEKGVDRERVHWKEVEAREARNVPGRVAFKKNDLIEKKVETPVQSGRVKFVDDGLTHSARIEKWEMEKVAREKMRQERENREAEEALVLETKLRNEELERKKAESAVVAAAPKAEIVTEVKKAPPELPALPLFLNLRAGPYYSVINSIDRSTYGESTLVSRLNYFVAAGVELKFWEDFSVEMGAKLVREDHTEPNAGRTLDGVEQWLGALWLKFNYWTSEDWRFSTKVSIEEELQQKSKSLTALYLTPAHIPSVELDIEADVLGIGVGELALNGQISHSPSVRSGGYNMEATTGFGGGFRFHTPVKKWSEFELGASFRQRARRTQYVDSEKKEIGIFVGYRWLLFPETDLAQKIQK